ncbi:MAG: hypothetical protein AB7V32_04960 [Candidatus Berkiella sp.]
MSVTGAASQYSESCIAFVKYLNPKIKPEDQEPLKDFTFENLTNEEVTVLEMLFKSTKRNIISLVTKEGISVEALLKLLKAMSQNQAITSLRLVSKQDISVDDALIILNTISENTALTSIKLNLPHGYSVDDLQTLRNFLTLPPEKQRPVPQQSHAPTTLEDDLAELRNQFSQVVVSVQENAGTLVSTASNSLGNLFGASRAWLTAYANSAADPAQHLPQLTRESAEGANKVVLK